MASNASNSVASKMGSFFNLSKVSDDKAAIFAVIGVIVILFVLVILYITFAMKSSNMQGKVLNDTPIYLKDKVDTEIIDARNIPQTISGREYSYAVWIYVKEFTQEVNNLNHSLIMYRGMPDTITSANPIIFMDALSNKLYVVVKTDQSTINTSNLNDVIANNWFISTNPNLTESESNKHLIIAVDYVPLQRWVHVGLVVDNKIMSLYLDGDLYSVKSIDEFKGIRSSGNSVNYNLVVSRTDGDVFIGKNPKASINKTINGYVGKLEFFNYALSTEEIKKSYNNGPIGKSALSWLGITQYGVRSPVYKISGQ